jgi:hypothetical protein
LPRPVLTLQLSVEGAHKTIAFLNALRQALILLLREDAVEERPRRAWVRGQVERLLRQMFYHEHLLGNAAARLNLLGASGTVTSQELRNVGKEVRQVPGTRTVSFALLEEADHLESHILAARLAPLVGLIAIPRANHGLDHQRSVYHRREARRESHGLQLHSVRQGVPARPENRYVQLGRGWLFGPPTCIAKAVLRARTKPPLRI